MRTSTRTLLTGLLLCTTSGSFAQAPANVGASITINSTSYVVSTKAQLAPGVEYYTMKATPKSAAVNFLRTNGTYNPTLFTQAKYAAFLSTGKLSAFGTLGQQSVNGVNMSYTTVGKCPSCEEEDKRVSESTVLLAVVEGQLRVFEYVGNISMAPKRVDDPTVCQGYTGADRTRCLNVVCKTKCIVAGVDKDGKSLYDPCVAACNAAHTTKTPNGIHIIPSVKPIVLQ